MRLSWNEIRARAAAFAEAWQDAAYEKGETQSFYNDFFEIFGVRRRTVARYEEHVKRVDDSHGWIDLFWPGVLLVEQKSAGRSLAAAREQAGTYFDALPERDRPRYQLLCDFQTFALLDRDERRETRFALADLPRHVEAFGFILGVQRRTFRDQDPVNVRASERMGLLHDALEDSGYTGHDLEQFLVRVVFCLFADNTGIFEPRDSFLDLLETRTREDGSDLGLWLARLFQVLDTPEDRRQKALDEDLARFPYVNGALFRGPLRIPDFDAPMREALLDACRFDWTAISPAIFGALFQSVMQPAARRAQGAHYTTEQNILKVIEPLFLDDLRAEFARLRARKDTHRRAALQRFQQKLGALRFLDPACGCGNFLIIAYRELRALEIDVIRELRASAADPDTAEYLATDLSVVNVDQFSGIEVGEFPARIAETALWMMDHIMNTRLSLEFGQSYVRIPLRTAPRIVHGDALELDWASVLPPEECAYVFGNPPFFGAKFQSPAQRAQVHRVAALGKSGGTLDYVAAWFVTAGRYVQRGAARIGFVATNSITQGEQVSQLWPVLFDRCDLEIDFAHRTFAWGSDARGKAHVHVVILGLAKRAASPKFVEPVETNPEGTPAFAHHPKAAPAQGPGGGKIGGTPSVPKGRRAVRRLFSYDDLKGEPHESRHAALSPYLFDAGGVGRPARRGARDGPPDQRLAQAGHRFQADRRRPLYFRRRRTRGFLARRTRRRTVAAAVRRQPRISARRPALDSALGGRAARRAAHFAQGAGTDRRGPRLPTGQQESPHSSLGRDADAVPRQRHPRRPVSHRAGSEFRTAGIHPDCVDGTAGDSEQQGTDIRKRDAFSIRTSDFRHAHGVGSEYRREAGKPLPVWDWCHLQYLSTPSGRRINTDEAGTSIASRLGRPRRASERHAGRPVRPGRHAAQPPQGSRCIGPDR